MAVRSVRVVLIVVIGLMLLTGTGCTRQPIQSRQGTADTTAGALSDALSPANESQMTASMATYDVQPVGPPQHSTLSLNEDEPSYALITEASQHIGLSTDVDGARPVQLYSYPLAERSQSEQASMTANFGFQQGRMVVAFLNLDGYYPGVVALSDRSQFSPPHVERGKLPLTDVVFIELADRWDTDKWERTAVLRDRKTLAQLTGLLASARPVPDTGGFDDAGGFNLQVHYSNGAVVSVSSGTFGSRRALRCYSDSLMDTLFVSDERLSLAVEDILSQ